MSGVPPVVQLLPEATAPVSAPSPSPAPVVVPPAPKSHGLFGRLWAAIKRLLGI